MATDMIDILIPTFNRADFLVKNIRKLDAMARFEGVSDKYRILVSDNHSDDSTQERLAELTDLSLEMRVIRQSANVGLEKNVLAVLGASDAKYVIYLGDDDFLPEGYLSYVYGLVKSESRLSLVIPGFSALKSDGSIRPVRTEAFQRRRYVEGFPTTKSISYLGHQLSGLVLLRENLFDAYHRNPALGNLYPFIFFVAYNAMRGVSYYVPEYSVLVSEGNTKDWSYDESGLLTHIFRSYRIAFPDNALRRTILCLTFVSKQAWRLRLGINPYKGLLALCHIWSDSSMWWGIKVGLLLQIPYLYVRGLWRKLKRIVTAQGKLNVS